MDFIKCELCNKSFKRITNTHLWKEHRISMKEYQAQFPDSPIDIEGLAHNRVNQALKFYGLECKRCGFTSDNEKDFVVHHKDMNNLVPELGAHKVDNLEVLCKPCHAKLHLEIRKTMDKFSGSLHIEKGIHHILIGLRNELGLKLDDENFTDTPKRVARAYWEIFEGVRDTDKQVQEILSTKFPNEDYDEIILVSNIKVFSMCPHHFLPVEYSIDIAYLPSSEGFLLGVSKLARLAEVIAKRPVLQEILTKDLAEAMLTIKPKGVAILVRGEHYCMRMRGVKQTDAVVETSSMRGIFRDSVSARNEFFALLNFSKRKNQSN